MITSKARFKLYSYFLNSVQSYHEKTVQLYLCILNISTYMDQKLGTINSDKVIETIDVGYVCSEYLIFEGLF